MMFWSLKRAFKPFIAASVSYLCWNSSMLAWPDPFDSPFDSDLSSNLGPRYQGPEEMFKTFPD